MTALEWAGLILVLGAIGSALYGAIASARDESKEKGSELELLVDLGSFFRLDLAHFFNSPLRFLTDLRGALTEQERFRRAARFAIFIMVIWFVLEIPVFAYRGLQLGTLRGVTFFAVQLLEFLILFLSYGFLLHVCLRLLGVRSVLPVTLSIFLYFTAMVPIRTVLGVPDELVDYWTVGKAKDPFVVQHPEKYRAAREDVLAERGSQFRVVLRLSVWATNVFVVFAFALLALAVGQEYEAPWWRTVPASLIVVGLVSLAEVFVLNPVESWIERAFR